MKELIGNLQKRASVLKDTSKPVHLVLKNGTWLNGYILKTYDDYFMILDREDGEVPVFFVDVKIFEVFNGDLDSLKKPEVRE